VFCSNNAQCEQVIDEYSMMVTGASGEPIAMSGSDTGSAASVPTFCAAAGVLPSSER
jgi:hypothetical protein